MTEEEKKAIDLLKFYEGFFKNIGHEEEVKSIEGVINLIEKLQKENEELKEKNDNNNVYKNLQEDLTSLLKREFIPKDKIREKIEELEKQSEEVKNFYKGTYAWLDEYLNAKSKIQGYKELLEEE